MEQELKDLWETAKDKYNTGRWVTSQEAEILQNLVKLTKPKYIYESGTANGISSSFMAKVFEGKELHTFDPEDRDKVWDDYPFLKDPRIIYHRDRFDSCKEFAEGRKLFFIDGDHSNSGVQADFKAIRSHITPGDTIVFHDLNLASVHRQWQRVPGGVKKAFLNCRRQIGVVFYQGDEIMQSTDAPYIPNLNTFADIVDRLIVEVNKLSFFENKKREEQAKPDKDYEKIAHWDNLSRDCCEYRSLLKNEMNTLLGEIVSAGRYSTLKEVRTFTAPTRPVAEIIAEMCEAGPASAKKALVEALEHEFY